MLTYFIRDLKKLLSRKHVEYFFIFMVFICSLSIFTSQVTTQQTLYLDNQSITYNGYVLAGKPSGQGKITFENGDTYEGYFKEGIFHGYGIFTSTNGWSYTGYFVNGLAEGEGILVTEHQAIYHGQFKQGVFQHEN